MRLRLDSNEIPLKKWNSCGQPAQLSMITSSNQLVVNLDLEVTFSFFFWVSFSVRYNKKNKKSPHTQYKLNN